MVNTHKRTNSSPLCCVPGDAAVWPRAEQPRTNLVAAEQSKLQSGWTHFICSAKFPKKFRCACVSGLRVFPAVSIQTACVTFTTSPPSPSHRGHPRWYRKRSSHIVPRRRQIAYINRQRPFIFPCQRFCVIILAPCRDFSSPNKRVKINRRLVEALYWDGIIPFTSLNGAGGQSNQGAGNVVIPGDFHRF